MSQAQTASSKKAMYVPSSPHTCVSQHHVTIFPPIIAHSIFAPNPEGKTTSGNMTKYRLAKAISDIHVSQQDKKRAASGYRMSC